MGGEVAPCESETVEGAIERLKPPVTPTDNAKPADVLVKSLLSPLYVAVSVRDPVVEKIRLQLPSPLDRVALQFSPVLLFTVTLCVGLPYAAVTLKFT
jgi:hypothetical protein